MATIQELEQALIKADAAGNSDDARVLAGAIRKMRSVPDKTSDGVKQTSTPREETSTLGAVGAGLGAGFGKVALGAQQYVGKGLEALGAEQAGQWLQRDAQEGRARLEEQLRPYSEDSPIAAGTGDVVGSVVATLPVGGLLGRGLTTIAPGAQTLSRALASGGTASGLSTGARLAGGATTGAVTGALMDPDNPGEGMALGAALGGAFPLIQSGIGRLISPKASTNPQLQALRKEGVNPTIGQALGGSAGRLEEKMMSMPLMGDSIRSARTSANEQFNKAALNRALKPIGEKVTNIGRDGIDEVANKLGDAYDKLIPKLQFKADATFSTDLQRLQSMAKGLEPTQARRFEQLLRDKVIGKLSPGGGMTGQTFKNIEGDLGKLAKDYTGSATAGERQLGSALLELQDTLRRTLERSNPQQATPLKSINKGYANYARLRQAGGYAGAEDGVFSAGQLSSAVKQADKSVGKGSYARGKALMQDLSDAGRNVLGNKVPDSGTAGRTLPIAALGGAAIDPVTTLSALGGGMAAYNPLLQRALVSSVASRPQSAKAIAEGFRKGSSFLAPGVVPYGFYSNQP